MPTIPSRALLTRASQAACSTFLSLLVLGGGALVPAVADAQRVRIIVLSFEGTGADRARAAAVRGLETSYEMVDEQAAIDAADAIGVDVSTPEGMSAVVTHLGIELVVGGFVEGRGRAATTTIWISDVEGNELSRRTAAAPSARGAAEEIGAAAAAAASDAILHLRPPEPPPDEVDDTPPILVEEDRPEEVRPSGPPDDPSRWRQPLIRGLVGLDLRNRSAAVSFGGTPLDFFATDFFPVIEIAIDSHPLAFLPGPENGLYLSLRTGFSAGLTYTAINGENLAMNVWHLEGDVGYAGVIANILELGGTLGLAADAVGLDVPLPTYLAGDFPSVEYFDFRPGIFARLRAFQDYLIVAFGLGGRVTIGAGQINNFEEIPAVRPPPNDHVYFGVASGGGVDFNIGLEGIIDPGFSYAARFGYTAHFLSFSDDPTLARERDAATDEAFHILLMVGWAFVPPGGPAPSGGAAPPRFEEVERPRTGPSRDIDNERPPPDPDW